MFVLTIVGVSRCDGQVLHIDMAVVGVKQVRTGLCVLRSVGLCDRWLGECCVAEGCEMEFVSMRGWWDGVC